MDRPLSDGASRRDGRAERGVLLSSRSRVTPEPPGSISRGSRWREGPVWRDQSVPLIQLVGVGTALNTHPPSFPRRRDRAATAQPIQSDDLEAVLGLDVPAGSAGPSEATLQRRACYSGSPPWLRLRCAVAGTTAGATGGSIGIPTPISLIQGDSFCRAERSDDDQSGGACRPRGRGPSSRACLYRTGSVCPERSMTPDRERPLAGPPTELRRARR